jgi:type III restriction enzyme
MNRHVNMISNRLSLRQPQRDSLEILARICDVLSLEKDADLKKAIEIVKSEFPPVDDFERNFPSLCFALATGVGKTRLMGAFISYLFLSERIRHYFVLAPNLTIYNKLIADFTPNTPKYVFKGIAEFSQNPPEIITGDNYESGRGVRKDDLFDTSHIHINIFNISKINSEVRGGNAPRIKRLSEYIGESYFEYLSKLDDLVLIMDEAHRYRASAGINAINELNPVLGLELTATPQVERGGSAAHFQNVIYSYPLYMAMNDGFVKEPAVATRENFDAGNYDQEGLEKLKLEDGIRVHENTKVELEVYSRENGKEIVKPFMLVVAQNTEHAESLLRIIEEESFFEGRYKGKVITVHSNQRGEEKDETVEQLLNVEDPKNPVEIVIHVNMLKEGWDVTNLYTIVPLRAANSKTLVEQSIGRGLRLPYGKRTGNPSVDRLIIVSHDRFQEIIDEANRPDSIIRTGVVIGKDIPDQQTTVVNVEPEFVNIIKGNSDRDEKTKYVFENPKQQQVALTTLEVIKEFEKCSGTDLSTPEIQTQIKQRVREVITPAQMEFEGISEKIDIDKTVQQTIELRNSLSIDVPRIIIVPSGDVDCGYTDFDMDVSGINLQPVDHDILIQHLQNHERYRLSSGNGIVEENRLEDYLVRGLVDFQDISYDDHSVLLYKLANQVIQRLRSYLCREDDIRNVLQYHQKALINLIHSQMQDHYYEKATGYEARISKGFISLKPAIYSATKGEPVRNFRTPVDDRQNIRSMLFGGFRKSLYPIVKFDSDPERRFSVMLENEEDVMKWTKPAKGTFNIHYNSEAEYEPDFIVETKASKYLCEPKRASEIQSEEVQAKAKATAEWCKYASEYENQSSGKPWKYLLIPHDVISEDKTLLGFENMYTID